MDPQMTEYVIEIAKQVPALLVLVWMVRVFINYLSRRDDLLAKIGDNCHIVQREATQALRENTQMLGEMREALHVMNQMRIVMNEASRHGS